MDDLPSGSLHVRLSSAIESMDQLFEQISKIVQREERERLYELLRCRRLLTSQIDTLAHLAEEAGDKASEQTLRRRVADLRYQIAELQSRWPAVMIDGFSRISAIRDQPNAHLSRPLPPAPHDSVVTSRPPASCRRTTAHRQESHPAGCNPMMVRASAGVASS